MKALHLAMNGPLLVKKALYTAASARLASYLLLNETGTSNVFGTNVPASVTVAMYAAIGSAAGNLLTDYVIKSMGQDKAIKNLESVAIKLGLAGASTVGSLKLVSGIDPSLVGFATGSLGKFVGDGINNQADNFLLGLLF